MKKISILIVDDSESSRIVNEMAVKELFQHHTKLNIQLASSTAEMFQSLRDTKFHVILLDHNFGEEDESSKTDENGKIMNGVDLIPDILEIQPSSRILVLTSFTDSQLAVKAIQNGAMGFITKSLKPKNLAYRDQQILKALREAQFEIESLRKSLSPTDSIGEYICKSKSMKIINTQLKALSEVNTPVLFVGESGSGKTHAAKRLHEISRKFYKQKERVFANINVNTLAKNFIESELFGYEKGAFTGATNRKQGLFELATDGDILLDEIGDASLALQGKLLKVIEEKEFRRLGGLRKIKTEARIMFATNKNIETLVAKGKFKRDLYARICAVTIKMPTLNERKKDIPYICQKISKQLGNENRKKISYNDFPTSLKEHFQRDNILFNIRGLKNDIERLMIFCPQKANGRIDYTEWKSILGDKIEIKQQMGEDIETLMELIANQFEKENWPGIPTLKKLLESKVFQVAHKMYPKNKDIAHVLGISESGASSKVKKHIKSLTRSTRAEL